MPHMRAYVGSAKFLVKFEGEDGVQWAEHGTRDLANEVALLTVDSRGGHATIFEAHELVSIWKPEPTPRDDRIEIEVIAEEPGR